MWAQLSGRGLGCHRVLPAHAGDLHAYAFLNPCGWGGRIEDTEQRPVPLPRSGVPWPGPTIILRRHVAHWFCFRRDPGD